MLWMNIDKNGPNLDMSMMEAGQASDTHTHDLIEVIIIQKHILQYLEYKQSRLI